MALPPPAQVIANDSSIREGLADCLISVLRPRRDSATGFPRDVVDCLSLLKCLSLSKVTDEQRSWLLQPSQQSEPSPQEARTVLQALLGLLGWAVEVQTERGGALVFSKYAIHNAFACLGAAGRQQLKKGLLVYPKSDLLLRNEDYVTLLKLTTCEHVDEFQDYRRVMLHLIVHVTQASEEHNIRFEVATGEIVKRLARHDTTAAAMLTARWHTQRKISDPKDSAELQS